MEEKEKGELLRRAYVEHCKKCDICTYETHCREGNRLWKAFIYRGADDEV